MGALTHPPMRPGTDHRAIEKLSAMRIPPFLRRAIISLALTIMSALTAPAQQQPDEIVRVSTELVQTDFMVFDKQGNFVDGLKRDQFLFKVEGKPRDISFLDRITAGSRSEEAQISAARGAAPPGGPPPVPLDRGRTVLFFIDDLHLSAGSVSYTQKMLKRFIEGEMKQNDQVEIASASNQLGFLEQLTDNKSVLLSAADRLRYQQIVDTQGMDYPPMTEYQAMQILRSSNTELFNFLVDKLIERMGRFPRIQAEQIIKGRASQMMAQSGNVVTRSFSALKAFVNLVEPLPGRKIVFFISDGFLIDESRRDNWDRLQRITNAAARSGVVIYSIDARGVAGIDEATDQDRMVRDPRGILRRSNSGAFQATQDGMSSLAGDTGGRALFNNNDLPAAVATGLKESSSYYLLAWRPETEEQRTPKFRKIELSVVGRPDLVVRFRRGFGEPPEQTAKKKKDNEATPARKTPDEEIKSVLTAPYPNRKMPVAISLNFLDTAQFGGTLRTNIKVGTSSLTFDPQPDGAVAALDVAVWVLNDRGKSVSSFNKRFTMKATAQNSSNKPPDNISYDCVAQLMPGLYQVRVAVIDVKNGARGSAYEWIEVPNIASKELTLSSLVIGERKPEKEVQRPAVAGNPGPPEPINEVPVNVDHKFATSSYLRVLTFIYNAALGTPDMSSADGSVIPASAKAAPDLAVQVQVFRDNEPVITTPLHKIHTEGIPDVQRVPYAAEVSLQGLAPGAYALQVTVIDRLAKASATRKLSFQIE
jgi:VWFA-related protein